MEKSGRAREFDSVIAADDGRIARELADGIMSDYPYFVPAMAAALRNCGDYTPEERSRIVSLGKREIQGFLSRTRGKGQVDDGCHIAFLRHVRQ